MSQILTSLDGHFSERGVSKYTINFLVQLRVLTCYRLSVPRDYVEAGQTQFSSAYLNRAWDLKHRKFQMTSGEHC